MPKILQFRRGTTSELAQITGAEGEIFVNLDTKQIHVHDGVEEGGYPLASAVNPTIEGTLTANAVIADSALLGTIALTDNTISPTDAYGNASTLTVDGSLEVKMGEQVQSTSTLQINYNNGVSYSMGSTFNGNPVVSVSFVSGAIPGLTNLVGKQVTTNSLYDVYSYASRFYRFTISEVVTQPNMYDPSQYSIRLILSSDVVEYSTNGVDWVQTTSLYALGSGTLELTFGSSINTLVTPLSVTESGVDVIGTLTVNGQPVGSGGASYDQNLNTTDDVLFNSVTTDTALLGNITVIDNTVSPTDAYGNAGVLTVDGSFEVEPQISTTTTQTIVNFMAPYDLDAQAFIATYLPGNPNCYIHTYSISRGFANYMLAKANGGVVSLEVTTSNGTFTGTVTLGMVTDQGSALPFYINSATGTLLNLFNGSDSSTVGQVRVYEEQAVTTTTSYNPLSVTPAGVAIVGALTVNAGGLNVQYGETTTTTQSVAAWSYGNSGTAFRLVAGGNQFRIQFATFGAGDPTTVFTSGSTITMTPPGGSTYQILLTSNLTWDSGAGSWIATCTASGGDTSSDQYLYGYQGSVTVATLVSTATSVLEATETGVAITGSLTVNGQDITAGGGASYDQNLNTTDDVLFNSVTADSALLGTMALTDNTISPTDSYGATGTLTVDGNLTVVKQQPPFSGVLEFGLLDSFGDGWNGNVVDVYVDGVYQTMISLAGGRGGLASVSVNGGSSLTLDYRAIGGFVGEPGISYIKIQGTSTYLLGDASKENAFGQYVQGQSGQLNNALSITLYFNDPYVIALAPAPLPVLQVTESGVAVEGTLTVNGQDITAGGASYDQTLNTTDDVLFNSVTADTALLGTIAVVDNTISPTDSYGAAGTLTVDGDLSVRKTVDNSQAITAPSGASFQLSGSSFNYFLLNAYYSQAWSDSNKFVAGTIISINGTTIELLSDLAFSGMDWSGQCKVVGGVQPTSFLTADTVTIVDVSTTEVISTTPTGVAVDGNLSLTGDLIMQPQTNMPTNPSSPVTGLWAKVVIGGQTYYLPLYQ